MMPALRGAGDGAGINGIDRHVRSLVDPGDQQRGRFVEFRVERELHAVYRRPVHGIGRKRPRSAKPPACVSAAAW